MDLREEVAAFGITEGDLSKGTPRKLVEKRGPKVYRVEVSGGGDLDVSPQVAIFEVSEESAREIIRLAELVKANDLHKVERFDYRTEFLQFDPENSPEDAEEQGDENSVRTECDSLVVTDQDFFFSAYVKHTDVKVACEGQLISELAAHFGVPFSLTQAANVAPTSSPM